MLDRGTSCMQALVAQQRAMSTPQPLPEQPQASRDAAPGVGHDNLGAEPGTVDVFGAATEHLPQSCDSVMLEMPHLEGLQKTEVSMTGLPVLPDRT